MRRPIETVPKDGTTVILEDDIKGTYELARWSAEQCAWVAKDGKPYNGTPTYWHALQRAEHLEGEFKPSSPSFQMDDVVASPPVTSSQAVSVADKQIPRGKTYPQARRRFAAFCGAAMIAAALTGMYFRGDVAAYVAKHADRSGELRAGSVPQGSPEQPRIIGLARNPSDAGSAPASAGQVTVGRAPAPQSPENHRRADAIDSELLNARQALADAQERETELKQTAETARTELQQSLDKIANLENELAIARQHIDQASLSPPAGRRIPELRMKQPNTLGFFGIFNAAPKRARVHRTARIPDER
jgi:hypothetical protein